MTALQATTRESLALMLREGTRAAHESAERSPFVGDLMNGLLPVSAYAALAAQNLAIYRALEEIGERWRGDEIAGRFVRDELLRVPQLERDLETLLGPDGPDRAHRLTTGATSHYVDVLHDHAGRDPYAFVAHHYVRYLGDLSGGQILRAALLRTYGTAVEEAVHFYTFTAIGKVKPFRDEYRQALNALTATADERAAMVAEARLAFALNEAVFVDLAVAEL